MSEHYTERDVKVRYRVQEGRCDGTTASRGVSVRCGAPLFPNFHVAMRTPAVEEHPCNLILLCDFCGAAHDGDDNGSSEEAGG